MFQEITTLGDLFELPAPDVALQRVKLVIQKCLPPDWQTWTVLTNQVLDIDSHMDAAYKARFAIPSVPLFRALLQDTNSVSERRYRALKQSLLAWPLGRALVFSPASISIALRGSKENHESFMKNVESLRPHVLSRKELNDALEKSLPPVEPGMVLPSPQFEPLSPPPVFNNARVSSLETQMHSLQSTVADLISTLNAGHYPRNAGDSPLRREDSEEDEFSEVEESVYESASPITSPHEKEDFWSIGSDSQPNLSSSSFFHPSTIEREPDIQEPSPELVLQGVQCQRLGEPSWDRVRYLEAEKRLKRSGIFQPLEMNSMFVGVSSSDSYLQKQERLLGTVTHGLLAQRQALRQNCERLVNLAKNAGPDLCRNIGSLVEKCLLDKDSTFRLESDALLQFVCGKRAEVLSDRRKAVEPKDEEKRRRLRSIPPSQHHIFDEDALTKWSVTNISRPQLPGKRPASCAFSYNSAKKVKFVGKKKDYDVKHPPIPRSVSRPAPSRTQVPIPDVSNVSRRFPRKSVPSSRPKSTNVNRRV